MKPVVTRIAKRTAKGVAKSYVKPIKVPPKGGKAAQGGDCSQCTDRGHGHRSRHDMIVTAIFVST